MPPLGKRHYPLTLHWSTKLINVDKLTEDELEAPNVRVIARPKLL